MKDELFQLLLANAKQRAKLRQFIASNDNDTNLILIAIFELKKLLNHRTSDTFNNLSSLSFEDIVKYYKQGLSHNVVIFDTNVILSYFHKAIANPNNKDMIGELIFNKYELTKLFNSSL